ncbi:hypothetical protein C2G38_2160585 [Gigaspora rosea]|uniref:Uncharacterized protein n=1 Tax=Gigaspora rosea TaxID=44941 RepID=A0A397W7U4_9GLOM|nr:hypothetical protein C2G38_2160585 [Gigaspora rosea]
MNETRIELQAVIDKNGFIYNYGTNYTGVNSKSTIYNDMRIFDTNFKVWPTSFQSSQNSYVDYTATLLPNGLIVYIGGRDSTYKLSDICKACLDGVSETIPLLFHPQLCSLISTTSFTTLSI